MEPVALASAADYESPGFENAVARVVDLAGGLNGRIRPGDQVLLKPNMLSAHPVQSRITTDPAMVLAVGRMVLDLGGRLTIADSPALDSAARVAAKSGLAQAAKDLGARLTELDRPTRVGTPVGAGHRSLELSARVLEADFIISLPKLKTHSLMLLTLGVKNLFGTVVGRRKQEWHLAAGVDRDRFAGLLLDIYQTVRPGMTILDGVWGMEGRGPCNGSPRRVGLVAASTDALAMDMAAARILGADLARFPLYRTALARGLVSPGAEGIPTLGDDPAGLAVHGFKLPDVESGSRLPGFVGRWGRKHLISRPVQDEGRCKGCRKCVEVCPADALQVADHRARFDYGRCLRCYCCQEVCPENAIGFETGWALKMVNRLGW
jgi:uncharacterized protein (DUF362 family)/ferredoxin-like protein FixX